jgi:methyl-accepting chemotaxis protein
MKAPSRNRFLRLLRRTSQSAQRSGARTTAADESALWQAHERALAAARVVQEATQRIVASSAKQRGSLEGLADTGRTLASRAQELERQVARAVDAFERLSIVALNASLEATRLGETQGRSLALVSDEVRVHATRGSETARALSASARDLAIELGALAGRIDEARAPAGEASSEALRAQGAAHEADVALSDMQERLRKTTGSDPEVVRAINEAAEHARALVAALGSLSGRVPRGLLLGVLSPLLEPLLRAVDEEETPAPEAK